MRLVRFVAVDSFTSKGTGHEVAVNSDNVCFVANGSFYDSDGVEREATRIDMGAAVVYVKEDFETVVKYLRS